MKRLFALLILTLFFASCQDESEDIFASIPSVALEDGSQEFSSDDDEDEEQQSWPSGFPASSP